MRIHPSLFTRLLAPALAFLLLLATAHTAPGCTIFVLTDAKHEQMLFGNNEDWSEPRTRIWFEPGGRSWWSGRRIYGCVFVGFPNGTPQGGTKRCQKKMPGI